MDIEQVKKSRKILRDVANDIEAHPKKYDQSSWCGTACCIAGHIVLNQGAKRIKGFGAHVLFENRERTVKHLAVELLGFNSGWESPIILNLFSMMPHENWHEKWGKKFDYAKTNKERAQIAADYIRKYVIPNVFPLKKKK